MPLPLMIWLSNECESWPCSAWRKPSSKDSVPTAATSSKRQGQPCRNTFRRSRRHGERPGGGIGCPALCLRCRRAGLRRDRGDGVAAARHVPNFDPQALGDRGGEHEGLHHAHADALRSRCRGNGAVFFPHPLAVVNVEAAHGDRIVADVERCPQLGLGAVNAAAGDRGQQVGAESGLLRQLIALAGLGVTPSSGPALRASSSSWARSAASAVVGRPDFGLDTFEAVNVRCSARSAPHRSGRPRCRLSC